MKKVLLYLASNSPFYTNLYPSIKRGFEEAGCLVEGGSNLLESEALLKKIETFQPDFVFEMNRVKSEIENFPKNVIHVCWLVDFWGRKHEDLKGSDILYVWSYSWILHFENVGVKNVHYLAPATDKTIYKDEKRKVKNEFVFLGHISKEWTEEELNRKVGTIGKNKKKLYFKDILKYIERFILDPSPSNYFLNMLSNSKIALDKNMDKSLVYDINSRAFRQIRREHYIDKFINKDRKLWLYGSENWALYEKYKIFYKGYEEDPKKLSKIIQSSQILLHDHVDLHFRTFDAMACGTVVVIPKAKNTRKLVPSQWKMLGFQAQEDYIDVDIYNGTISFENLNNKKKLEDIAQNAKKKVLAKHLWVHRALKVIEDVKNLKKDRYAKD